MWLHRIRLRSIIYKYANYNKFHCVRYHTKLPILYYLIEDVVSVLSEIFKKILMACNNHAKLIA